MTKIELPQPTKVVRAGPLIKAIIFDVVDLDVPKTVICRPQGHAVKFDTYVSDDMLYRGMMRRCGGIIASARRAEKKRAVTGQQLMLPLTGGDIQ